MHFAGTVSPESAPFHDLGDRLRDLRPLMRATIALWREDAVSAMDRGIWYPRSGPARRFAKRKDFGDLQRGGPSKLRRSGRLRRALLGGEGGFERITQTTASWGIQGIPYAVVHRGGSGQITADIARRPHRLVVTPRMRAFLGRRGVHLRENTKHLVTERRPFATVHPRLRTQAKGLATAHVVGRLRAA